MRLVLVCCLALFIALAFPASARAAGPRLDELRVGSASPELEFRAPRSSFASFPQLRGRLVSGDWTSQKLVKVGLPMFAVTYVPTIIGGIFVTVVNDGARPAAVPLSMIPCLGPILLFRYTATGGAPAWVYGSVGVFTALQTTGFVLTMVGLSRRANHEVGVSRRAEPSKARRLRCRVLPWGDTRGAGLGLVGAF